VLYSRKQVLLCQFWFVMTLDTVSISYMLFEMKWASAFINFSLFSTVYQI
jgi:hypothetical protein